MPRATSFLVSHLSVLALLGSGIVPAAAQTADTTPSGMVAFFMSSGSDCPPGWSVATQAQGRLILGAAAVGAPAGQPLADQTAPTHSHSYQATVGVPSRSISASHCCDKQGAHSGNYTVPDNAPGQTAAAESDLPLIQLLVCQKQ